MSCRRFVDVFLMPMHYEVLDEARRALVPHFASFRDTFYLAGGTGLALHIGHRISIDFDFFATGDIDTSQLYDMVCSVLGGEVPKVQEAHNTLVVRSTEGVQISFFGYHYPLLEPLVADEHMRIASVVDIGCMKLSAIVSRAVRKDYVDLFFILKQVALKDLLAAMQQKMPLLDRNLVLKALVSFDDVESEPIQFHKGFDTSWDTVQAALAKEVRSLSLY